MIAYIIKSTACALLFYVVYVLWLEKENMHGFKRIYLIGGLAFAMIMPFVAISVSVPQIPAKMEVFYAAFDKVAETADNQPLFIKMQEIAGQARNDVREETIAATPRNYSITQMLISVYVVITLFLLFRMLINCWRILARGRKNACADYRGAKIALIDEKAVPHSFGRYIFLNREDYDNGRIPNEVIVHEWTHFQQGHIWDILFIETLITFGWFNPVFYLYKSKIRQNHEFLADDAVIGKNREHIPAYQTILINHIPQNINLLSIISNFNFLITKKRIIMMTRTKSKKRAWCKGIALIPVFIAAIWVFSTKTAAQAEASAPTALMASPVTDNDRTIIAGRGVSQEQLVEYQEIVNGFAQANLEECGYCRTSKILNAGALLDRVKRPSRQDILLAFSGIKCRCNDPEKLVESIERTVELRQRRLYGRAI